MKTEDKMNMSTWPTTDGPSANGTDVIIKARDNANLQTTPRPSQPPDESFLQYEVSEILMQVVPPFIMMFGTFGNVMTMMVMRMTEGEGAGGGGGQTGDLSMSVYFMALAVCDQTVLTIGLTRKWVKSLFHYDVRNLHPVVCKLHKYIVYSVGKMSTWILVAVTSQRVMTVLWPLRHVLSGTRRKAVMVVVAIVCSCCLLDLDILIHYSYITTKSGKLKCRAVKDSLAAEYYEDLVYPWLSNVTSFVLPLTILVINNVILGWKVQQSLRASRAMTDPAHCLSRGKQATSLSLTLVVTSLAFFLLTSSIPVGFFVKRFYLPSLSFNSRLKADVELVDTVLDLLWYTNSAVNFYLYCLTGTKFRTMARTILSCGSPRQQRSQRSRVRTTTSTSTDLTSKPPTKNLTQY